MPNTYDLDIWLYLVCGIIGAFLLGLIIVNLSIYFSNFTRQLRYLNGEIKRTRGSERKHYIRRRRRLWLSLIPFVKER